MEFKKFFPLITGVLLSSSVEAQKIKNWTPITLNEFERLKKVYNIPEDKIETIYLNKKFREEGEKKDPTKYFRVVLGERIDEQGREKEEKTYFKNDFLFQKKEASVEIKKENTFKIMTKIERQKEISEIIDSNLEIKELFKKFKNRFLHLSPATLVDSVTKNIFSVDKLRKPVFEINEAYVKKLLNGCIVNDLVDKRKVFVEKEKSIYKTSIANLFFLFYQKQFSETDSDILEKFTWNENQNRINHGLSRPMTKKEKEDFLKDILGQVPSFIESLPEYKEIESREPK